MGNILQASILVTGTRALFFHKFGPESIPLEKQERTGVAGNDPEEWRKTVSMTKDRQLYVEPSYVFGCMRDGAKYTKQGRGSIQTAVCATLQIANDRVFIMRDGSPLLVPEEPIPTDSELPVYIDIRSVKNPATKGRNVRYRVAASAGWQAAFILQWDKTIVAREQMLAALKDAGVLCGIGDGRSIGYGRFAVTSCTVEGI